MTRVAIIDSGGANIASVKLALARLGFSAELTTDPAVIRDAERVILPGVGAAAVAMQRLRTTGLDRLIPALEQPVLGICLGMQLLFEGSAENDSPCLGILEGWAARLPPPLPVPHMGWNRLVELGDSRLLRGLDERAYVYFLHSFAIPVGDHTVASSHYGTAFAAIVERDNFFGTQFHPERSGPLGARILTNFLREIC